MKVDKKIKACLLIAWMPSAIFALFLGGMCQSYFLGILAFVIAYLGSVSITQGMILLGIELDDIY